MDGRHIGIVLLVSILTYSLVIGKSFCISLSNFVVNRRQSYEVIWTFQDGGHKVGNVLPGSVLVMALVWEDGNLLAYQILMIYLNPWLR